MDVGDFRGEEKGIYTYTFLLITFSGRRSLERKG